MYSIGDHISKLSTLTPSRRVEFVLQNLWPEFNPLAIENAVRSAFSRHNFHTDTICPIWPEANNEYVLEMFYGPTGSFKDIYSLLFPYLISSRKMAVMASGGSGAIAALNGFVLRPRAKLIIFYPKNEISAKHYIELTSEDSENVIAAGVDDSLVNIQTMLDSISFRSDKLTLLHSIRLGKTAPLAAIILSSYCELLAHNKIAMGEAINIIAPEGHSSLQQAIDLAMGIGVPISKFAEKVLFIKPKSDDNSLEAEEKPIVQDAIVTLGGMENFIRMVGNQ